LHDGCSGRESVLTRPFRVAFLNNKRALTQVVSGAAALLETQFS
jgi:hypothetical protein